MSNAYNNPHPLQAAFFDLDIPVGELRTGVLSRWNEFHFIESWPAGTVPPHPALEARYAKKEKR